MNLDNELNPQQAEAAKTIDGPVLILAGAGSGKTRTLMYRIANMLENGINPWNILALTFTNKAAKEMKDRIEAMIPDRSSALWISTFHSTCLRIMFSHADKLGYTSSFEIADQADQKAVMREVYKKLEINPKQIPERSAAREISQAKDRLQSVDEYVRENMGDFSKAKYGEIYREYQERLKRNNSMDFDDLIFNTVKLFREFPEILESYQEKFKYIMVDEYQDTNTAQFEFIRLLASKYKNLCVVGDDDQSIYRFRGADIRNILDFETNYPEAHVIKLEENYRSTGIILEAANEVIANNTERKQKALWTKSEDGGKIRFRQMDTSSGEAAFIADDIRKKVEAGANYKDFAILLRTNIQSKEFEDAFRVRRMDYEIVKGLRFWDTKVIKDISAYLLTVAGGSNDMRTNRIVNLPKRGIGASSLDKVAAYALSNGLSLFDACVKAEEIPGVSGKALTGLKDFTSTILAIREAAKDMKLSEVVDKVIEDVGYNGYMLMESDSTEKYTEMREYIDKLKEALDEYEAETEESDLIDFMRQNGVEGTTIDKLGNPESDDRIRVMTMHNAKGLEFPNVYVAGMEQGLFPGYGAVTSENPTDLEEERRLCYVAMTRAEKTLTLTCARQRMVNGEKRFYKVSQFLGEIPNSLIDMNVQPKKDERKERVIPVARQLAHAAFAAKPMAFSGGFQKGKAAMTAAAPKPDYEVGDRVRHFKLGEGVVKSIVGGGKDYEVTIEFDKSGTKKMFAQFAKLKRV